MPIYQLALQTSSSCYHILLHHCRSYVSRSTHQSRYVWPTSPYTQHSFMPICSVNFRMAQLQPLRNQEPEIFYAQCSPSLARETKPEHRIPNTQTRHSITNTQPESLLSAITRPLVHDWALRGWRTSRPRFERFVLCIAYR